MSPEATATKVSSRTDARTLSEQRALAAHIAAEYLHSRNAEAEREECLIHSRHYNISEAYRTDIIKIRHKIEANSLARAGKRKAVHRKHDNKHEQGTHHYLADTLKSLLHAYAANEYARYDRNCHP